MWQKPNPRGFCGLLGRGQFEMKAVFFSLLLAKDALPVSSSTCPPGSLLQTQGPALGGDSCAPTLTLFRR